MGFATPHSAMRFVERVNVSLPKKRKQRDKFIENYLKNAYIKGTTTDYIKDKQLKTYMLNKLHDKRHLITLNKITLYNNNLFLFVNRQCITVLNVPDELLNSDDNIVNATNLKSYINRLDESKKVKSFLLEYGKGIDSNLSYKKINIDSIGITYSFIIDNFPTNAIEYIKNDFRLRQIIIETNRKRDKNLQYRYYVICSLLLMFPKKEIINILDLFKNKRCGFIDIINKRKITKKQINVCCKQLSILLGHKIKPQFEDFKVTEFTCGPLLYDYIMTKMDSQIKFIKKIYRED